MIIVWGSLKVNYFTAFYKFLESFEKFSNSQINFCLLHFNYETDLYGVVLEVCLESQIPVIT